MGQHPERRLRRNRQAQFIRDLTQENWVNVRDLVYPLFIVEGSKQKLKIDSMPGQFRYSIDELLPIVEYSHSLGIKGIALFPSGIDNKDNLAIESYNPQGLIPRAIAIIKENFPEMGVFTDIALDPYTIHGQDGIIDENGYILNDLTCEVLIKQSLMHAAAGADFVCPSDMMDGRIGKIRKALEENRFVNTGIMAYAAKYASKFYGPFRDAVGSAINLRGADKFSYQMNPANGNEAIHEAAMDIAEGADIVMVKPGLPYLDIVWRLKNQFQMPTAVYHVSGEYAMLQAAAQNGWLDYNGALLESMLSFKRAGADIIWTYAALDVANILQDLK